MPLTPAPGRPAAPRCLPPHSHLWEQKRSCGSAALSSSRSGDPSAQQGEVSVTESRQGVGGGAQRRCWDLPPCPQFAPGPSEHLHITEGVSQGSQKPQTLYSLVRLLPPSTASNASDTGNTMVVNKSHAPQPRCAQAPPTAHPMARRVLTQDPQASRTREPEASQDGSRNPHRDAAQAVPGPRKCIPPKDTGCLPTLHLDLQRWGGVQGGRKPKLWDPGPKENPALPFSFPNVTAIDQTWRSCGGGTVHSGSCVHCSPKVKRDC